MHEIVVERLAEVRSLYKILPNGTEGGKEFSRIVDLLLFHEAQRMGREITIFNDSAGDYHGLDSFKDGMFRLEGTIGYQYKFYPSPLSPKHRGEIEKSLKKVIDSQKEITLSKWILVTPEDLTESSTRADGGDVTWFKSLYNKLPLKFEIEHYGHTKLKSLFIETPSICLYYYPELIPNGATRRKTIQDTRKRYIDNLNILYRNIEFVGMSVYKQEATRGVPIEHIYIPLTAVPDSADENDINVIRLNPLAFLMRGKKSVILGDPGSGKSTLLRFLALSTFSKQIQQRYEANRDDRLPIIITLRRYADELKERKNLSLIDYIMESVLGDYSLKSADLDFFEYFLESGQAILLFDGLDELPNPQFKIIVRDRIRTLNTTYPGNTTIVTSRIVGYSDPFRFYDKEFTHYRLTRLQLPEIERFVKDWYRVRIENKKDRDANVSDLVRILRDENHIAIRELAQNPLLLTIVTLVHRIDAVLPDERVVLYKKCTETLLNTWHAWKYRNSDVRNRGKIERYNLQRMEAIAYWIHCQSESTEANQRSVVKHKDLVSFLSRHIANNEKLFDKIDDPEDLAEDFLEFIKKRAGLLIEIGDNQYSFVHLTFQEYLTASFIITNNEIRGSEGIWNEIMDHCSDAKWHEVIRLLVASLRSEASQKLIVEKILSLKFDKTEDNLSLLLGGILIDGIGSADIHKQEIFEHLLKSANYVSDAKQLRNLLSILRPCLTKESRNKELMISAFKVIWNQIDDDLRISMILVAYSINFSEYEITELTGDFLFQQNRNAVLLKLFFGEGTLSVREFDCIKENVESLWIIQNNYLLSDPYANFVALATHSLDSSFGVNVFAKRMFEEQLTALANSGLGPFLHLNYRYFALLNNDGYISSHNIDCSKMNKDILQSINISAQATTTGAKTLKKALEKAQDNFRGVKRGNEGMNIRKDFEFLAPEQTSFFATYGNITDFFDLLRNQTTDLSDYLTNAFKLSSNSKIFESVLSIPFIYVPILNLFSFVFELKPLVQWQEAIRAVFLPQISRRINLFNKFTLGELQDKLDKNSVGETEIYTVASSLLFDSWLSIVEYSSYDESSFANLALLAKNMDCLPINIADIIRDISYGKRERIKEFVSLVKSSNRDNPDYFKKYLWYTDQKIVDSVLKNE
jgi:hypothetical protein